jgi:hypothetical protein
VEKFFKGYYLVIIGFSLWQLGTLPAGEVGESDTADGDDAFHVIAVGSDTTTKGPVIKVQALVDHKRTDFYGLSLPSNRVNGVVELICRFAFDQVP